jgi:hypothetical protein
VRGSPQGSYSFAWLFGAGAATPISRPAGQRNATEPNDRGLTGGQRDGQWEGEALTGTNRPNVAALPRPVNQSHALWVHTHAHPQGYHTTAYPIQRLFLPQGGWQFRRAWCGHGESIATPEQDQSVGFKTWPRACIHAACAAMGYPMSLSRYLDPYPVLFHGVSVSQKLTHSLGTNSDFVTVPRRYVCE